MRAIKIIFRESTCPVMTATTVQVAVSAKGTSRKFDSSYADRVLIFSAEIVGTSLYVEGMLLPSFASITLDFGVTIAQVSPVMAMERAT